MRRSRQRTLFLEELAKCGNVSDATRAAGMSRDWAYKVRRSDLEFANAWDDALETAADLLEKAARRRAVQGWNEPAISAGKWVHDDEGQPAYIRKYSDRLLEVLLRGARPAKYGTKQLQVSGQVDHRIIPSRDGAMVVQRLLEKWRQSEARHAISQAFLQLARANSPQVVDALPPGR